MGAVIAIGCGGGARPAQAPSGEGTAIVGVPANEEAEACAVVKRTIAEEMCDPEGKEPCAADRFPCALAADLDGDGVTERIAVARDGAAITLGVTWGDGRRELVATAARPLHVGETDETIDELSWIVDWHVVRKMEAGVQLGPTDGDAIWVSGTDAAAALFRRGGVFVLEHLGY